MYVQKQHSWNPLLFFAWYEMQVREALCTCLRWGTCDAERCNLWQWQCGRGGQTRTGTEYIMDTKLALVELGCYKVNMLIATPNVTPNKITTAKNIEKRKKR